MMWFRVARPSIEYLAVFGLQSNFHRTLELPLPSPAGSKLYSQPSPAPNKTCGWPPSTPYVGDDHCPCRMLSPGDLSVHSTLAVVLSMAKKLGAFGDGILMWSKSTPFDVQTKSTSPTQQIEQLHMLCWATPIWAIMSNFQMTSASSLFSLASAV